MAFPESGVTLVAETSAYTSAMDEAIKLAEKADAQKPVVKVTAETSELDTASRKIADIDSATTTVKVNSDDAEIDRTQKKVDSLDSESASVKVTTDDQEVKDTSNLIEKLKTATIAIGVTVTGAATAAGVLGLTGVIDYDNALASIEGRTGRMIPDAKKLIHDIYTNGWGESRQQIADVIVEANNLGIAQEDLGEATTRAFEVAGVTGYDTNEVLRSMNSLVKNDLTPSYSDAADVIVTGFQNGADRGQDLLDTFNEYGSTFGQLKISGSGALSLINSGLQSGIDNSDRIADAIRETGIRLSEIGTNDSIKTAFDELDGLSDVDLSGLLDLYNAGSISGDDFFAGFFQALSDANAKDPTKAKNIAATLVGTIAEDFGTEAISQLSPVWDGTMGDLEGRATEAGSAISDTLGTSIQTFFRNVEESAVSFLSSDTIDLPGKIELLKQGLQDGLASLQAGGTLSDAFAIALKPIGFDDEFRGLESALGNFMIALLQVVSSIQGLTGHGAEQATTDATIKRLGTQQLQFDLQIANAEDISNTIGTAAARGVESEDIATALSDTISGKIKDGAVEQAQALLTAVQEQAANYQPAPDMSGLDLTIADVAIREGGQKLQEALDQGIVINKAPGLSPEAIQGLQDDIDEAIAQTDLSKSTTDIVDKQDAVTTSIDQMTASMGLAETQLDTVSTATNAVETAATTAGPHVEEMGTFTSAFGTAAQTAAPLVSTVTDATKRQGVAASNAASGVSGVASSLDEAAISAPQAASGLGAVNVKLGQLISSAQSLVGAAEAQANAGTGGGGGTQKRASGGQFTGTSLVGEQGMEIVSSDSSMAVLNNKTVDALIMALQSYLPFGSFGGGGGSTSLTINNNNFVPNVATADRLGYSQSQLIRGQ